MLANILIHIFNEKMTKKKCSSLVTQSVRNYSLGVVLLHAPEPGSRALP